MIDTAITYESELNFIARCALDYENIETGGDFFGFWNKNGIPVIQFVTGPGINTTRTNTSFFQDIPYLHKCGEYLNKLHALEHIGSWHSHHKLSLDHPSGGDVTTMKHSLDTKKFDRFFITICNIIHSDTVKINGFIFSNSLRNIFEETKWDVLPESSPVRIEINKKSTFFTLPKTKKAQYQIKKADLHINKPAEKADLPTNYYFETESGRKFLKNEFDKIKENKEFNNVEIIQNEDRTIAISFEYDKHDFQIQYPLDFSENNPIPKLFKNSKQIIVKENFDYPSMIKKTLDDFFYFKIMLEIRLKGNKKDDNSQKIIIPLD